MSSMKIRSIPVTPLTFSVRHVLFLVHGPSFPFRGKCDNTFTLALTRVLLPVWVGQPSLIVMFLSLHIWVP